MKVVITLCRQRFCQ